MSTKYAYITLSIGAPVFAIALAYEYLLMDYVTAWWFAVAVIVCMEARVQLHGRTPHTVWFWTHLVTAALFFLLLSGIAFASVQDSEFIALDKVFFVLMIISAWEPWYGGLKRALRRG